MVAPRLVFLYGPPAVGKLTVARAIAAREPFKILHNRLTLARPLQESHRLTRTLRGGRPRLPWSGSRALAVS